MTEKKQNKRNDDAKGVTEVRQGWWRLGLAVGWLVLPAAACGQWSGTNPVTTTSFVGIGTTTPAFQLHVVGSAHNAGVESTGNNYNVLEFKTAAAASADKGTVLRFTNPAAVVNGKIYDIYVGNGGWFFNTYNDDWSGGATRLYVERSGKVGIGTVAPVGVLHVSASSSNTNRFEAAGTSGLDLRGGRAGQWSANVLYFSDSDNSQRYFMNTRGSMESDSANWRFYYSPYSSGSYQYYTSMGIYPASHNSATYAMGLKDDTLIISGANNVGIGTTNPQYKLSVNGTIQAKEVLINTGWADHVFQPQYRLKPLGEVASFIREKGHLPGIPTEAEVKEKGVGLGEMQVKLLEKIEELTLHMIAAEERSDRLEEKSRRLEKENLGLRERLARLEARLEAR